MNRNILLDVAESLEKEKLIAETKEKDVMIRHYLITENDKKTIHEEAGDYFVFSFDDMVLYEEKESLKKVLKKTLKTFLKKYHKGGTILFIGLGSKNILGDSFGPKVLNNLI